MADRIRLELDQRRAAAVHAAISESLGAHLLAGDRRDAAWEVLELLGRRVPGWLEAAPVGGEAGYLVAAEGVLRALIDAEDRGRDALSEPELLHDLGEAKPLGATAHDVLGRMRRERLITARRGHGPERWWAAARAGRQLLYRDTGARDEAWTVRDPDGLLDLIYAEHPTMDGHRPCVQAIGRLDDTDLEPLLQQLRDAGLLEAPDPRDPTRLALTLEGINLAWTRWRESAPGGRHRWERPPAPALPNRRDLAIRIGREDRLHPGSSWRENCAAEQELYGYCSGGPAAWLQRSSKTKLWATLRRDGAVTWKCQNCDRHWIVYLQAFTSQGRPAYRDPSAGTYNRPMWRPTHRP